LQSLAVEEKKYSLEKRDGVTGCRPRQKWLARGAVSEVEPEADQRIGILTRLDEHGVELFRGMIRGVVPDLPKGVGRAVGEAGDDERIELAASRRLVDLLKRAPIRHEDAHERGLCRRRMRAAIHAGMQA
jgi:hypothetical protein